MSYPKRRRRRVHLECEALELKALLATVSPAQLPTPTPTAAADIQALQQIRSNQALEWYITQIVALESQRSDVQQYATAATNTDLQEVVQLQMLGQMKNVILPNDISGNNAQIAMAVLGSINSGSFDQNVLPILNMVATQTMTLSQNLASTTQDADINAVATEFANNAQMQIMQLQTLINTPGTATGLGNVPLPTETTSDAQFKQQHFSGSQTDLFLSQTAALIDPRMDVQTYAKKLVDDHTHDLEQLTAVAINEGLNLQGGILGNDQQTARQVLAAAGSQSFDQTYLQQMVQMHTQDMQSNQQELNQTQDPNLRAYISSDLNTDFLHLLGAQALLSQSNNNGGQHNRVIVLRRGTFNNAVRQLNQAANQFERTFNINALANSLFRISAPLAFGHSQLFPVWMNDLGLFSFNTPGSDFTLIQQLQADLFGYLQFGQANGLFVVR